MFNVLKPFRKVFGLLVPTASRKRQSQPTFKPRLEALEVRWCPSTADTLALTQPASPDFGIQGNTLYWKPVAGSQNANLVTNWYDQQLGRNLQAGDGNIGQTNPIFLSGNTSNSPIEFTLPMTVEYITVQNGWQNTMTIDAGATVTTYANNSINNSNTVTLVSKDTQGIVLNNNNIITVQSGGTLILKDQSGATKGGTFITTALNSTDSDLLNLGTVTWNGTGVGSGNPVTDILDASVYNTGTFNANGGQGGDPNTVAGVLHLTHYTTQTNDVGFYMTSGALKLTNGASLAIDYGYYQSGGSLTSDASTCQIMAGSTGDGDINIAGGNVQVDTVADSYATLKFKSSTVEINGEIDVSGLTQGGFSSKCDVLNCGNADVNLGTNSYLNVGTTGSQSLGTGNRWTVMMYGSITNKWGKPPTIPPTMSISTGATDVLISN